MDTQNYHSRYTAIIDKLDLDEVHKELLKTDWLDYLTHLEKLVHNSHNRYRLFTTISIVGGITIPALSAFNIPTPYDKMVTSVLGIITASCIGLNQSFKFNDKWKHFRRQAELARIEGERFVALAGEAYRNSTHRLAFPTFIDRLATAKNEEIKEYIDTVNTLPITTASNP